MKKICKVDIAHSSNETIWFLGARKPNGELLRSGAGRLWSYTGLLNQQQLVEINRLRQRAIYEHDLGKTIRSAKPISRMSAAEYLEFARKSVRRYAPEKKILIQGKRSDIKNPWSIQGPATIRDKLVFQLRTDDITRKPRAALRRISSLIGTIKYLD